MHKGGIRSLQLCVYLLLILEPLEKTQLYAHYFIHNMRLLMFKSQSAV